MNTEHRMLCSAFPAGVQYKDFEIFELSLGPLKDWVTVKSTHAYVGFSGIIGQDLNGVST